MKSVMESTLERRRKKDSRVEDEDSFMELLDIVLQLLVSSRNNYGEGVLPLFRPRTARD